MCIANRRHVYCLLLLMAILGSAHGAPLKVAYDADGMIIVNGARTFILGSYYVTNKFTKPTADAAAYQAMRDAGFNLVSASGEGLDFAHAAGLMAWTNVGTVDLGKQEESQAQLRERIMAVKDHPAVAFYEQSDEPAWTWIGEAGAKPGAPRVTAAQFAAAYKVIQEVDGSHLVYTNHAPTNLVSTLQGYNAGTDIVAADIYPVNPGGLKYMFALFPDGHQGDYNDTYLSQVGRYTRKMREVAGPNRPVFMVLQAFAWEALLPEEEQRAEKILYPSYEESRFMAFQSVINGANGIVYWGSHFTPQPSDAWTGITRVVRELADLSPVLVGQNVQPNLSFSYHEIGFGLDEGVQWLAKEHDSSLYLFTSNADKHRNTATISGLADWKTCEVLNEGAARSLAVEQGTVTDTWERLDTHVYRFQQ